MKYPSGSELAAFRRAMFDREDLNAGGVFADHVDGPPAAIVRMAGESMHVTIGGAWPHEREHGIGYRLEPFLPRALMLETARAGRARRGAARQRHATAERIALEAAGDAGLALDYAAAQERYAPGLDAARPYTVTVYGPGDVAVTLPSGERISSRPVAGPQRVDVLDAYEPGDPKRLSFTR